MKGVHIQHQRVDEAQNSRLRLLAALRGPDQSLLTWPHVLQEAQLKKKEAQDVVTAKEAGLRSREREAIATPGRRTPLHTPRRQIGL